jgi:hypothetical protein
VRHLHFTQQKGKWFFQYHQPHFPFGAKEKDYTQLLRMSDE